MDGEQPDRRRGAAGRSRPRSADPAADRLGPVQPMETTSLASGAWQGSCWHNTQSPNVHNLSVR